MSLSNSRLGPRQHDRLYRYTHLETRDEPVRAAGPRPRPGPGLFTTDLALSKVFNLYESLSMKLEVQAQNAFNHANLANPSNTCIDCAGNGQINDILGGTFAGMRQLQFVARFSF
jgi:hypothetical protein